MFVLSKTVTDNGCLCLLNRQETQNEVLIPQKSNYVTNTTNVQETTNYDYFKLTNNGCLCLLN